MESAQRRDTVDALTAVADDLLEQAVEIRRRWAEVAEVLGVDADGSAPAVDDRPAVTPAAPNADEPARLAALEMMFSGCTREDVRAYLDETFGAADRDALLDDVFASQRG
jgi:hypothetical protein